MKDKGNGKMRMQSFHKEYLRRLLFIAVPIILSNLISQLQMIIDRIFLGHADDLYMSALSNATTPMWATMSFCFSLVAGASILISQSVGAGDTLFRSYCSFSGFFCRNLFSRSWVYLRI